MFNPTPNPLNVNTRQLELEVLSWILQLLLIVSDSYYKHCFWLLICVNSLRLMASRCCSCAYALVSPWNLNIRPRHASLTTLLENKKRGKNKKNVKKRKKRDQNKKRKKRFFTSMLKLASVNWFILQRTRRKGCFQHQEYLQTSKTFFAR